LSADLRSTVPGLVAGIVLLALGGCTSAAAEVSAAAPTTTVTAVPADATTQRIAEVEFARQCAVTGQAFADESAFTTDLDARLGAAGLTHAQWKDWHDALAVSPDLLAQVSAVGAPGCPPA
jgi:hypothetical protein